ncbi:hypothetical protein CDAR_270251 [Caerostris darwini]|uniref:Uncharacterized protein n=1 Tax=Caerostris darwini TaxID=1538125 RepID=A0AAV4NGW1_9ARAC|nr:hypothetical protein CDAR_270251 [Caerostris darwini]
MDTVVANTGSVQTGTFVVPLGGLFPVEEHTSSSSISITLQNQKWQACAYRHGVLRLCTWCYAVYFKPQPSALKSFAPWHFAVSSSFLVFAAWISGRRKSDMRQAPLNHFRFPIELIAELHTTLGDCECWWRSGESSDRRQ